METLRVSKAVPFVAQVTPAGAEDWDQTWAGCDFATYFHSREWAEIWRRFKPDTVVPVPKLLRLSDGTTVLVPCLIQARVGGLLPTHTTSIEGTFGGWISRDPLDPLHTALLTDYVLTCLPGSLSWRLNPYAPHADQVLARVRACAAPLAIKAARAHKVVRSLAAFRQPLLIEDQTHSLDLRPGFDVLFRPQSSSVRKAKKARGAGVKVGIATRLEQWREYYGVYQSSLERWKKDPATGYPWELFEVIYAARSPNVRLWIATLDARIVSGALCFYAKRHVAYWHGSSLAEFFDLRPVNLLMLEAIRDACEQGYGWFDFNPSGHLPGVIAFKESFGARPLDCPVVYVDTPIKRLARALVLGVRGYL
jgi:hypothetical protein